MNTARAADGQLPGASQPSAVKRIPGPAWAFLIVAIVVAALWFIVGPIVFLPSEFWALRPIQLANGIATVLLGAALFIRRPDVWSACRPLGAAVVLFAASPLLGAVTSIVALAAWRRASLGLDPDDLTWGMYGFGVVANALGIAAIAFVWLGLRRSRRRIGGLRQGSRRLAVALWISTLCLLIGRLSSLLRTLDGSSSESGALIAVVSFTTAVAEYVALTALTVTAIAGARAGERPGTAWWLAAASGLIVILGAWLVPLVDLLVGGPVALFVLLLSAFGLVSTLSLLSAFALGLSSAQGKGDDQRDAGAGEPSSDLQPA